MDSAWGNGEEIDDDNDDDDDDDDDDDNNDIDPPWFHHDDDDYNLDDDNIDDDDDDEDSDDDIDNDSDDDDDDSSGCEIEDEIVEKFVCTFHNGDYDTAIDNALSSDRTMLNSHNTHPTHAAYDKPVNWIERNRIGLERVIQQLLSCIVIVKNGTDFNLDLNHNRRWDRLVNNQEPIVWHEPIVDRYWGVIEAEIDRRKQLGFLPQDILNIHIENVEITNEFLAALVDMLSNGRATNSSKDVYFNNVNLCGKGIVYLSTMIEVSSKLQIFRLYNNRIDNLDAACCLSRSLKSHTCINELDLTYCDLGSSPEILSVILQSDVNHIYLSNNNINSLGAAKIAEYLEGDPPIQFIHLDNNRLNDDDVILISLALKQNTSLMAIHIHTNNFSSIGVKALLACVFDNSSLNAISEYNHTLKKMKFFVQEKELACCMDRILELDWTEKILLVMQDKDSLLQYLANVPVELIPEVLAFPLRWVANEHQHKHLNLVYSTMRWWNMPMLYSYHSCVKSDTKRKRDN